MHRLSAVVRHAARQLGIVPPDTGGCVMNSACRSGVAAIAMLAAASIATAQQKPQDVNHDNDHSWKIHTVGAATVTFVAGPAGCVTLGAGVNPPTAGPPLGAGSLRRESLDGVLSAAQLRNTRYHRTYLADLVALEYWTCAFTGQNNGQQ